ncbi:hypothetical protein [Romboutsia sp.]|uniref:hypothetical protein n=1 Tax=Romboutsia sp. TaxID=1965302 RepID=UPI002CEF5678|nr:hypothetical protein [Romboutsia sp.]HSQ90203.1 hypothetical protein [Romboutsia sp.]
MDEREIINNFLNGAIKEIDEEVVKCVESSYQKGEDYDKETLDDLIYQKRLLGCYL